MSSKGLRGGIKLVMVNNNVSVNSYTYGNTARELVPEIKRERKPQVKQRKNPKNALKAKFKIMLSIVAICAISFLILLRFASIVNMQGNIKIVKEDIAKLQKNNENIKVDIALHNNLKNIEDAAVKGHNMTVPQLESIYYVDVKPLTLPEKEENTTALSFLSRLLGLIN